jgi:hypothetical protein
MAIQIEPLLNLWAFDSNRFSVAYFKVACRMRRIHCHKPIAITLPRTERRGWTTFRFDLSVPSGDNAIDYGMYVFDRRRSLFSLSLWPNLPESMCVVKRI